MEISYDIFLFFWMEKKLILLSHICSIQYMGLVLWLWSFESNVNAYSPKNRPFCVFTYCEKSKAIFVIVDFFVSSLLCTLNLLSHIWTSPYFQLQGWTVAMNRAGRFEPLGAVQFAFEPCHIFNCKVEPLYDILNRARKLFPNRFIVVEIKF